MSRLPSAGATVACTIQKLKTRPRRASGVWLWIRAADALRGVAFPDDGSRVYAWAACEYQAFRAIRSCLREERRLQAHEHLAVAYWRRGEEGD